jgi:FAD dependent oxidoreductase.
VARLSHRAFQDLLGPRYGVHYIEQYWLGDEPHLFSREREIIADLFPLTRELGRREHPFDAPWAARDATMIIEPPIYLNALVQDFRLAGGRIVVRDFSSQEEILGLEEPVILNCTGLGAKALFGDEDLTPIKGQLIVLLPQPEVDYVMAQGWLYMFPRADGILLGGTFQGGVWDLEPDQEAFQRVLAGHDQIFARMRRPRAA